MLAVATGANQWAITEESILALRPSRVEALDASGGMIRVTSFDRTDEDDASTDADKRPRANAEDRFNQFARLLNEAADKAAARHESAYTKAFEELVKLVSIVSDRLGSLEKAWMGAIAQSAKAQAEAAIARATAGAGDGDGDAVSAALVNMMGVAAAQGLTNGVAAKVAGKTNGAPKAKES